MKRTALKRKTRMKRRPWRRHMSKADAKLRGKLLDGSWEVETPKLKRITRSRMLTPEEGAENDRIERLAMKDFPPLRKSRMSGSGRLEWLRREGFIEPSKMWIPYELPPKQPTVRQRRNWLKQESDKRKIERRIYNLRSRQFLQEPEHKWCELMVTCGGRTVPRKIPDVIQVMYRRRSTQVHHVRGRGKWYLVERYWKGSCLECHAWEDSHRNEAVKLGLRERVYEKH